MTESLIVAGQIELLQGGVVSAIPACAGASFVLAPGFDLSAPQNTTSTMVAEVLDGERPVGRRASNREISLPVVIRAPDRLTLAAAKEVLLFAVDHDAWQLTWTRDGTLPMVLDCFRAQCTMGYELLEEQNLVARMVISFQALPYGRSDVPVTAEFQAPLAGKTAPPATVTIDDYSTGLPTGSWTQKTVGPGPFSAYWSTGGSGVGSVATYSRTGIGPFNLTGLTAFTIWAGFGSSSFFPFWGLRRSGPVLFKFTLTDNAAHTISFHKVQRVKSTNSSANPFWQKIRAPVPQGAAGFSYANVTAYSVTVSARPAGDLPYTDLYLALAEAVPVTRPAAVNPAAGTVYDLAGLVGSARSLMSLQLQQPAGTTSQGSKQITISGPGQWVAPAGVTVVKAECVGGGGGGEHAPSPGGKGGGGAESAAEVLPVTPGNVYSFSVGSGGAGSAGANGTDTTFTGDGGLTVTAHKGTGGATTGAGGTGYVVQDWLAGTQNGNFDGGIGTWVAAGNSAVAADATQHDAGTGSIKLTSVASGDMAAAMCSPGSIAANGKLCWAGVPVKVNGKSKAQASARSFSVGAEFYDGSGTSLGQLYGASTANNTTTWTAATTATLTPPANAVRYRTLLKVVATGAASEVHWGDTFSTTSGYQFNGGTGGTNGGTAAGGGGGSSGGSAANGNNGGNAPNPSTGGTGGAAVTGGGAGGNGNGSPVTGPFPGHQPGGGGGGGYDGGTRNGGNGGTGKITLTYTQTAGAKTILAHRPGPGSDDTLSPFVSVPVTDVPDGTTEYAVPSLVPESQARFGSTYTIIAVNNSWHTPANARTVTVTVNHYEQSGGSVYTQSTPARTVTPNNLASQFVVLGELTIPDHAMPPDNVNAYFTVTITSGDTADRFQDILFLDTLGSTVMIESPTAYVSYWIDEPTPEREIGFTGGSVFDRNDAVSVLAYATVSGPPLHVDPLGSSVLFVYAADGTAPSAEMTYWPRWMLDRAA